VTEANRDQMELVDSKVLLYSCQRHRWANKWSRTKEWANII